MANTDFINKVQSLVDTQEKDPSAEAWASRMFSIIMVLGTGNHIDSESIKESLAVAMSKAPDEVFLSGTLGLIGAIDRFQDNK